MSLNKKVVLTCAINGGGTQKGEGRGKTPYLPITVEEVAADAKRAYDAGAAIIHLHARNPETNNIYSGGQKEENTKMFLEMSEAIKAVAPKAIINFTTGGGMGQSFEERLDPVLKYKPPIASFTGGMFNYARYSKTEGRFVIDGTAQLSFATMVEYAKAFRECGTKAECEIYDFGHINNMAIIRDQFEGKIQLQFVMNMPGQVTRPTVQNIVRLYELAKDTFGENGFLWGAAAAGFEQWGVLTTAAYMGADTIRAGLEDNIYIEPGVLSRSNGESIEKAVKLARSVGREIASPEEAIKILGLRSDAI